MMALQVGAYPVTNTTGIFPLAQTAGSTTLTSAEEASAALMQNMFAVAGDSDNHLQEQLAKTAEAFEKFKAEMEQNMQVLAAENANLRIALTQSQTLNNTQATVHEAETQSYIEQIRASQMQAAASQDEAKAEKAKMADLKAKVSSLLVAVPAVGGHPFLRGVNNHRRNAAINENAKYLRILGWMN